MFVWWDNLPVLQQLYYLIAIPSTVILLLQTLLLLVGGGGGEGAEMNVDVDTGDVDMDVDSPADYDASYAPDAAHEAGLRLLTVRGIIAFLTVFGWVGVAALDMGIGSVVSFVLAVVTGAGAMALTAAIVRASLKLQQSGNLEMRNAVGVTGEVYLPIAEGKKGKVILTVQGRFMELDAVCPERPLKRGEQVQVTAVTESNTLVVTPLA